MEILSQTKTVDLKDRIYWPEICGLVDKSAVNSFDNVHIIDEFGFKNMNTMVGRVELIKSKNQSEDKNYISEINSRVFNSSSYITNINGYYVSRHTNSSQVSAMRNYQNRGISVINLVNEYEHDVERLNYCKFIDYLTISSNLSTYMLVNTVKSCSNVRSDMDKTTVKMNGWFIEPVSTSVKLFGKTGELLGVEPICHIFTTGEKNRLS